MGTQQILLIVLSVIIVGIAVAVGITMFNAQATNANRQAMIGDMNNFAASALAYYKTPATHGGGGNSWTSEVDNVGTWLGYDYDSSTNTLSTDNGSYALSVASDVLTITGTGNEIGNDGSNEVSATMTITGSTSAISTSISN